MRTGIFFTFLALSSIADAINNLAGKATEPMPGNVLTFLGILLWMFIIMDVIEFFKKLGHWHHCLDCAFLWRRSNGGKI